MLTGVRRLLVFSPNWLGDAVMALPAIADLRQAMGGVQVIVAARSSVAGLFRLAPAVDEVVTLEWRGRPARPRGLVGDLRRLRAAGADVAVLLPNSFASAWLAWAARVPERWGYAADMRGLLLTRAVPRPAGSLHQGRYYQELVRACGAAIGPLEPVLSVPAASVQAARALLEERGWDGRPFVAVAPGAAYGTAKRWLPEHFARVITALVMRQGVSGVLVGSGADSGSTRAVRALVEEPARPRVIDLSGTTSLETLAGVLRLSAACMSNDSGAMHLAAAVGVPLAALFGPTRDRETAPLARTGVRAEVLVHPVACRPCMLRECPIDHPCMRDLDPRRVYHVMQELTEASLARNERARNSEP